MWMSVSGNPASRNRCAIAPAAVLTLPTESVVLISISCLKMSWASCFVESSSWAFAIGTSETAHNNKRKRFNIPPRDWNLTAHLNAHDDKQTKDFNRKGRRCVAEVAGKVTNMIFAANSAKVSARPAVKSFDGWSESVIEYIRALEQTLWMN